MIEFGLPSFLSIGLGATRKRRLVSRVHDALMGKGEEIAADMREADSDDTGALDATIGVEATDNPLRVDIVAGGEGTTRNGYDYALAQEFGTAKMPAQPFFYPTIEAHLGDDDGAIEDAVTAALEGD